MNEKKGLDELLSKKSEQVEENNTAKEDLKTRMNRLIKASKKLNSDDYEEEANTPVAKNQALKDKLEKAKMESEKIEEELKAEGEYADNSYTRGENEERIDEEYVEESEAELKAKIQAKKAEYLAKKQQALEEELANQSVEETEEITEESIDNQEAIEEVQIEENPVIEDEPVQEVVQEEIIATPSTEEITEKPVEKIPNNLDVTGEPKEELHLEEVPHETKWKKALNYVIKTMNGMAYGLFATLIIGTIISTIGTYIFKDTTAGTILNELGANLLQKLTGIGIGIGIAYALGYKGIKLVSVSLAGGIASFMCYKAGADGILDSIGFKIGDPLTIYLVVIITSILLDNVFRKRMPVEIILIPLFTSLLSASVTILISKYVVFLTSAIGNFIGIATEYQPVLMGILISVIMGMCLTLPISSAAIAATIFITGTSNPEAIQLAAGAALIGCSTQMVGFAVQSIRDNNAGKVIAIGIGTSMLQFKNIIKKPIIWLPTIITSAILGPISTTLFKVKCAEGAFAGMGTSGLVGQIGTFMAMGNGYMTWIIMIGFEIILPAIIVFLFDLLFRKLGLIKKGDFTI